MFEGWTETERGNWERCIGHSVRLEVVKGDRWECLLHIDVNVTNKGSLLEGFQTLTFPIDQKGREIKRLTDAIAHCDSMWKGIVSGIEKALKASRDLAEG